MIPAMVLCAGFGTRLRPLTNFLPKPLLPVGDRAALIHILDQLRREGFGPLVVNSHHRANTFSGLVPSGVNVLHEPSILGTGGGVQNARAVLGEGNVLVWNGDIQIEPNLKALVGAHRSALARGGAVATMLVEAREKGTGTVGVGEDGTVVRLRGERFGTESAGADYLGLMVLSARARSGLPNPGCLIGDALMPMLREGQKVATVGHRGPWVDIGTPVQYLEANLRWLRRQQRTSWCAPKARVAPSVQLVDTIVDGGEVEGKGIVRECVVLGGGRLRAPCVRCIGLPGGASLQLEPIRNGG